jgi:hypothetical protein
MLLLDVFCLMQWAALGRFLPVAADSYWPFSAGRLFGVQ